MATTELLLLKPVEDLGNEGDQVKVKSGYARNFLLPRGYAIPVTRSNRKQIDALKKRGEERLKKELDSAEQKKAQLETIRIALAVKTGPGGRVFGAITAQNIIDRIAEDGLQLDRKQLTLPAPVKELGKHTAKVKLHADITVEYDFEVVSENPIMDENGVVIVATEATEEETTQAES